MWRTKKIKGELKFEIGRKYKAQQRLKVEKSEQYLHGTYWKSYAKDGIFTFELLPSGHAMDIITLEISDVDFQKLKEEEISAEDVIEKYLKEQ